jgi:hypothetical protein
MRSQHPPRLAALLLQLFAPNEPLAGDLHEEYLAGRSAVWYWRQVMSAILFGPARRIEMHELFAVQNMFMQCVMLALVSVCVVFTVKYIAVVMFEESLMRALVGPRGARELFRFVMSFSVAIPIGIAIARLHVRSRRAAVLAFSTIVPLWAFVNVFLLNGHGNLDSALPHVIASLVFIAGLLSGGIHVDALTRRPA